MNYASEVYLEGEVGFDRQSSSQEGETSPAGELPRKGLEVKEMWFSKK